MGHRKTIIHTLGITLVALVLHAIARDDVGWLDIPGTLVLAYLIVRLSPLIEQAIGRRWRSWRTSRSP